MNVYLQTHDVLADENAGRAKLLLSLCLLKRPADGMFESLGTTDVWDKKLQQWVPLAAALSRQWLLFNGRKARTLASEDARQWHPATSPVSPLNDSLERCTVAVVGQVSDDQPGFHPRSGLAEVLHPKSNSVKPRRSLIVPIKFRCNYCRQFLGISRAQAGGVVDCPTCGRSIRVPLLDGSVQPMPGPELDMDDTHLSRALDELAKLVDAPVQAAVPVKSLSDSDDVETENQIPQPLPEPIPIEVPLPPTPIVVVPPTNVSLGAPSENGIASDRGLLAELAALSDGLPPVDLRESKTSEPATTLTSTTRRPEASPFKTSLMLLVPFVAGMLTERFVRVFEARGSVQAVSTELAKKELADNELTGRITFKSKEGESQPDRGARVIVFPQQRTGEVKLSVVGFRPADSAADQLVANAAMKALGGAAATVDDHGVYRLPIEAGSYRMLVLSHFQPRTDGDADPTLDKLLTEYFDKPEDLLGRVQHQFSPLRIKGTDDTWDHSF